MIGSVKNQSFTENQARIAKMMLEREQVEQITKQMLDKWGLGDSPEGAQQGQDKPKVWPEIVQAPLQALPLKEDKR